MTLKNKSRAVHFLLDGADRWPYVLFISKGNQARLQENRPMTQYLNLYFVMMRCLGAIYSEQRRMAQNPASSWHAANWRWAKTRHEIIFLSRLYLILAQRIA